MAAQQALFPVEELVEAPEQEELLSIEVPGHKRTKRRRREIPAGTPVRRIVHAPAVTTCGCCGKGLAQLREDVTKILNYIPAQFELEEQIV